MRAIKKIIAIVLILVGLFFALGGIATMSDNNGMAGSVIMIIIGAIALALAAIIWKSSRPKEVAELEKPVRIEKLTESVVEPEKSTEAVKPEKSGSVEKVIDAEHASKFKLMPDIDQPWPGVTETMQALDDRVNQTKKYSDLTPYELFYLSHLRQNDLSQKSEHWEKYYGFDTQAFAQKYLNLGYGEYVPLDPEEYYTVEQLKEMLRASGQKVSGLKYELAARFKSLHTYEELVEMNPKKEIRRSKKGKSAALCTPYTLLHDHLAERDCMLSILSGHYREAEEKIERYLLEFPMYSKSDERARLLDKEPITRLKTMRAFNNDIDSNIYSALCILNYLWLGLPRFVDSIYVEGWVQNIENTRGGLELKEIYDSAMNGYTPPQFIVDENESTTNAVELLRSVECVQALTRRGSLIRLSVK